MSGVVVVAHLAQRCLFLDQVIHAVVGTGNRAVDRVDNLRQTIRLIVYIGDGAVILATILTESGKNLSVEKIVLVDRHIPFAIGELSQIPACVVIIMRRGSERVGVGD